MLLKGHHYMTATFTLVIFLKNDYYKFMKNYPKDPLHEKGIKAEEIVQELAQKSFFTDWCYPSPELPNNKEICDLLVIHDNIAIIWSIKDTKLEDRDNKLEKEGYKPKYLKKSINQLNGAYRTLFNSKETIELENPRRGKEIFEPNTITEIYLINVLMGKEGYYLEADNGIATPSDNKANDESFCSYINNTVDEISIITLTKRTVEILLNELDTISDFCEYLRKRKELFESDLRIVVFGEENLLAYYLYNNRSFPQGNLSIVDGDMYARLIKEKKYIEKKKLDEISIIWDYFIDTAHHSNNHDYEIAARELARPNRFMRRELSNAFIDAQTIAPTSQITTPSGKKMFQRRVASDQLLKGTSYYFLFVDASVPREERLKLLSMGCHCTRGLIKQNTKVIGIATELAHSENSTFDFCLMDNPDWNDQDEKVFEEIKKITGWCSNLQTNKNHVEEYPTL